MRITSHVRKQLTMGNSISSTIAEGVNVTNWADGSKEHTLHRQLMAVESIYDKTVINSKSKKKFRGRLFYSIIPNQRTKSVTFYFSKANAQEARGVARGLPLFIRDFFKLDPSFFCSSESLTIALEGFWDYSKRIFLTAEEKDETEKLDNLESELTAQREIFISKDQQRAMAQDGGTIMSEESRLTKGDVAPPRADLSVVSALTGETRESKAKAYAAEESKKVAAQYIGTIATLNTKFKDSDKKVENLQSQLELALKALADATAKFTLDPQVNEGSALSSDLSRSSDELKCATSDSSPSNRSDLD